MNSTRYLQCSHIPAMLGYLSKLYIFFPSLVAVCWQGRSRRKMVPEVDWSSTGKANGQSCSLNRLNSLQNFTYFVLSNSSSKIGCVPTLIWSKKRNILTCPLFEARIALIQHSNNMIYLNKLMLLHRQNEGKFEGEMEELSLEMYSRDLAVLLNRILAF